MTAICAKADADGDSYRPFVCDPRCDCLSASEIAEVSSCDETAPGTFQVVQVPAGACGDACDFVNGAGGCTGSSFDPCDPGTPCSGNELCVMNVCVDLCSDHSECTAPVTKHCTNTPIDCTSAADCLFGSPCEFGKCRAVACTQDSECASTHTLEGVGAAGSPAPVNCTHAQAGAASINANDALECIAQIEAALGQACTTLP